MEDYRWVYDSRHLQADCKESASAPEPYARQSSMGRISLPLYLNPRRKFLAIPLDQVLIQMIFRPKTHFGEF